MNRLCFPLGKVHSSFNGFIYFDPYKICPIFYCGPSGHYSKASLFRGVFQRRKPQQLANWVFNVAFPLLLTGFSSCDLLCRTLRLLPFRIQCSSSDNLAWRRVNALSREYLASALTDYNTNEVSFSCVCLSLPFLMIIQKNPFWSVTNSRDDKRSLGVATMDNH